MADVFVSYAHKDGGRIGPLAGAVEESGYSLWWDERLVPGDDYAMVIERELAAARCVVVAWSASARDSLWVRAEANEALDGGKLVQLTLDGAKLPLPFTILHYFDFKRWSGGRETPWPDLDGRISDMLRGEMRPLEPEAAEAPLQGLRGVALMGWASVALAALVAIVTAVTAGRGALDAGAFSLFAFGALAVATILLALTGWTTVRAFRASRR